MAHHNEFEERTIREVDYIRRVIFLGSEGGKYFFGGRVKALPKVCEACKYVRVEMRSISFPQSFPQIEIYFLNKRNFIAY